MVQTNKNAGKSGGAGKEKDPKKVPQQAKEGDGADNVGGATTDNSSGTSGIEPGGAQSNQGGSEVGAAGKGISNKRLAEIQKEAEAAGMKLVNAEGLEKVLNRMDELEKKQSEQQDQIIAVSDKGRMNRYNEKNKGPMQRTVKLTTIQKDGEQKVVIAWGNLVTDKVYKNQNNQRVEEQVRLLILEDKSSMQIGYLDSVKLTDRVNATITKRLIEDAAEEGGEPDVILIVRAEHNDKEYTINAKFVN